MGEDEVRQENLAQTAFQSLLDGDYGPAVTFLAEHPLRAFELVERLADEKVPHKLSTSITSLLITHLVESLQEDK